MYTKSITLQSSGHVVLLGLCLCLLLRLCSKGRVWMRCSQRMCGSLLRWHAQLRGVGSCGFQRAYWSPGWLLHPWCRRRLTGDLLRLLHLLLLRLRRRSLTS